MTESRVSDGSPSQFAARLTCWSAPVQPEPLSGGITNTNFVVHDGGDTFVVRIGDDLPLHGIIRRHELATCVAAHNCGLSPEIVHHEPGAMVMRFIDATTLTGDDIRQPETLRRVAELIQRCHAQMPRHLHGPSLMFWVFQTCRNYLETAASSPGRLPDDLSELGACNEALESAIGPMIPVFCHNDLLAANILDDGETLWLLDWEYAGWNSAYFDLANLASNNEMTPEQESVLLETYFGRRVEPRDRTQIRTMKCASLLRETLWSLVQEQHSSVDFDYAEYTNDHLARFRAEYAGLNVIP